MLPKTSGWIDVTPEIAKEWLEHNPENRNLRPSRIAKYAAAMKAGKWNQNQDSITFSNDGILTNGQHRLYAVIESGVESVRMHIIWGVEQSMYMDYGAATRRPADNLQIRHPEIEVDNNICSAYKLLWQIATGSKTIEPEVLEDIYIDMQERLAFIPMIKPKATVPINYGADYYAVILALLYKHFPWTQDIDKASEPYFSPDRITLMHDKLMAGGSALQTKADVKLLQKLRDAAMRQDGGFRRKEFTARDRAIEYGRYLIPYLENMSAKRSYGASREFLEDAAQEMFGFKNREQ